ncbi:SAM-dependent methyltransferase [Porphyromonas circumdentaria]|uniref:16S rRNA (Cytidine1402-2'-O)-methyltransferase n=1 Tax=Porphyromonas circumdentaria TaxID=29524 RepID=A0A1T4LSD1_9PORP|nr:SAM-dependent methyltransferase [Porphyromonas circumdentaria]MBB6275464.1 16S rRNA (cytidine1402-2'-O)-methyltransferase [Porphyromonas circumdentaria]SJZ57364.1 16S rRNA (cytidine1402-2'-O)-methyltransferase [Porphyromonas circumdentaria]
MQAGVLYMIPVPIAEGENSSFFPVVNAPIVEGLELFFVENIRSARRAIRSLCPTKPIDPITFIEIGKHADEATWHEAFERIKAGVSAGVLSEAGCPGVADPGAQVARWAHQQGVRVVPLIGPSSLLMGLMASGLNGQRFAFVGYLPREGAELKQTIRQLEQRIASQGESQLFIETPYRNQRIAEALWSHCQASTRLCIAQDITGVHERIVTKTIAQWRKAPFVFEKLPTLFILGA